MGKALRHAYGDIFLIKEHPTTADKAAVLGKFKSYHNATEPVAQLMTKTFYALLSLAEFPKEGQSSAGALPPAEVKENGPGSMVPYIDEERNQGRISFHTPGLHYNIQIHLPATKDVEVYNAIFKSLKEHLIEG